MVYEAAFWLCAFNHRYMEIVPFVAMIKLSRILNPVHKKNARRISGVHKQTFACNTCDALS